jgi:N-acetylglucosaminyl-diphospho-decaprenol L-rhamnosyltransferase
MVTVVIPNFNVAHMLPDCLASLRAQAEIETGIIVVDNGSIDESEAVVARYGAVWLPLGANRGLAAACNAGAAASKGEFLFFANADMRFEPACLAELVRVLQREGEGAFSADPLQYDWPGERVIHFRTVLRPARTLRERLSDAFFQLPPLARSYVPAEAPCAIPWGCAGSLLVRRVLFERLGGFDPSFFLDFEDVDLCWRAGLQGYSHWFVPRARLYHHWGAFNAAPLRAARPDLARRLPRGDRARVISTARNHTAFAVKALEPEHARRVVAAKLLAAAVYAVRGRPARASAMAEGVRQTLARRPVLARQRREVLQTARVTSRDLLAAFSCWEGPDALIWPADTAATLPRCGVQDAAIRPQPTTTRGGQGR